MVVSLTAGGRAEVGPALGADVDVRDRDHCPGPEALHAGAGVGVELHDLDERARFARRSDELERILPVE
jgi:hypothetical protein